MKIALCQINTVIGDFNKNSEKILSFAKKAKDKGADLAVFPEMCVVGYPPRDLVDSEWFVDKAESALHTLVESIPEGIGVIVGCVLRGEENHKPYNSAVLFRKGMIEFIQNKTLLPNYDVFDERRNFESATEQNIFWYKGIPIGIEICEDGWANRAYVNRTKPKTRYNIDPTTVLIRKGAQLIINISASPFHMDKWREREELLNDIVSEHDVDIVYTNAVGGQDSLLFDGRSMVMTSDGVMAQALSFHEDIVTYDTEKHTGEHHIDAERSELYQALVMGLRDYTYKCGFQKAVIGLSGGLDSSICACLAAEALGKDNVTGLLMPSKYSSDHSITDAKDLANNLGIDYKVLPITSVLEQYKYELDGADPDGKDKTIEEKIIIGLAEDNLQSRIRGNYLLAYSNRYSKTLVIACSNKSEVLQGYTTLGGDMLGGISPLADVYKTKAYELANSINEQRKFPLIPFNVIHKSPSAELHKDQFDTDTLPDYSILDQILVLYVEERLSEQDIHNRTGFDTDLIRDVIRRVDANEFKRQQAPPNLKVTKMNMGSGYARRLPIARKIM